ncbi:hypothetical protein KJI95_14455 [Shewanella sp. JM162201]|uniref:Inner membrane protein n=1 Tax=Shewanella jiangmenensis TaxID=2837387 RepID=A0ABS5V784_9GAMM|nr:hypothetical protein [Shewanella jiangmenensis]MBT1445712.1 hypothetical protein [Shewanella jiangmenensis]
MWWRILLVVLACLLTGAHFLRYGNLLGALAFAAAPLLCFGNAYLLRALQLLLLGAVIMVWGVATFDYVSIRLASGAPWLRLILIMSGVMAFVATAAWAVEGLLAKKRLQTAS